MPAPPTAPPTRPPSARTIRPPRGLPSSRAAVGGLLVAVAAMGTWAVATGDGGDDLRRYAVAARPVAAGVELTADDLTVVEADLPDRLRATSFDDPRTLVGAVTRGPLGQGELVQAGSVVADPSRSRALELSFSVEPEWAVAGGLGVGDRIDVFATDDDGATVRVLVDVSILGVDDGDSGGLGAVGVQTVTVAADDPDDVADAVSALRAADVTVIRRNRPAPSDEPAGKERDGER